MPSEKVITSGIVERIYTKSACYKVKYNGEAGAKAAGKLRLEGKEYLVQDGVIFHFRFNV